MSASGSFQDPELILAVKSAAPKYAGQRYDGCDLDLFMEHWLECGLDDPNACWPDGPPAPPIVQP